MIATIIENLLLTRNKKKQMTECNTLSQVEKWKHNKLKQIKILITPCVSLSDYIASTCKENKYELPDK